MSKQFHDHFVTGKARIVEAPAAPARHQVEVDRNFELPVGLYATTVGLYFAFLGVLFAGLATPGLIIPMAIFAVFIVGIFGVPAVWTRLKGNVSEPMTMGVFERKGIMTHTGHCNARDAKIQMLILPVLIVAWACAIVTIVALV